MLCAELGSALKAADQVMETVRLTVAEFDLAAKGSLHDMAGTSLVRSRRLLLAAGITAPGIWPGGG
jgi:hypothetical protein